MNRFRRYILDLDDCLFPVMLALVGLAVLVLAAVKGDQ
jgi:hypothetical protein